MKYDLSKHVYFISYTKIPNNMAAAVYEGYVGLGFVVNYHTGIIEDTSCTLLTEVARNFLKSLIVGYNIHDNDVEPLIEKIKLFFHGYSQKAICVIVKENYVKYHEWSMKNKKKIENTLEKEKKKGYNDQQEENVITDIFRPYPSNYVYFISYSKVPRNNSLVYFRGYTGIGFAIDFTNDVIMDCCLTFITDEAKEFAKLFFLGKQLNSEKVLLEFETDIGAYFNSSSQKALSLIAKNNFDKYQVWKKENIEKAALFMA
jgi:hypothetical protein